MSNLSDANAKPAKAQPDVPPFCEGGEQPPPLGTPYQPYSEKPAQPEVPYKPYAEKPGHEPPYEPYKGI